MTLPRAASETNSHIRSRGGPDVFRFTHTQGSNRMASVIGSIPLIRDAVAVCFGTVTVKDDVAPAVPGVTVAGEKLYVAPAGSPVAVSVTEFVNGAVTEVTLIL